MQKLLKPNDVADRLSVSRAWVYDAAKVGRIPAIRIGGQDGPLRFVAEDVERWLDDARASWTPGRSTAVTRRPPARARRRGPVARSGSAAGGQQSLI
jgi:excisionase family DNA binding protein